MGFITNSIQISGDTHTSPIITKIYTGDTSTLENDDGALVSSRVIKQYVSTTIIESGGTSALNELTDVNISNPQNDDVLTYSNGEWVNSTGGGGSGTVTEVSSSTTNQLTVLSGTTTPTLSIQTASIIDGGTSLATGDQIYDFVIGLGYTTNVGDITEVTAGNGLSGGGTSGGVTVTMGTPGDCTASTLNTVTATSHTHAITTAAVINGGTELATGDQIYDFVIGLGYTTNTGDITAVTAGTNLTGGGTSGSVTLNVATSPTFSGDVTANSFIKAGGTSSQFLKADGSVDSTSYTTNVGDITAVTAGNGLSGGGTSGGVTVTMGTPGTLSNSTTNSVTTTSHTHAISDVYLRNNVNDTTSGSLTASSFIKAGGTSSQFLKADGSVDSTSYTSNIGDITAVTAGNGLSGGGTSGGVTVTMGTPGTCTASTSNSVSTSSHTHAITTAAVVNGGGNLATGNDIYDFVIGLGYTSNTGDITAALAGNGLTGGGYSGNVTLNVASHSGTAGSIGTVNISADAVGVNLGTTSTTAFRGDYGNTAYSHVSSTGTQHSYINQSVTTAASPTFANLTVSGTLSVRAAIDLADNDILRLGSSDDWEFFHSGTHNYIDCNTGDLYIRQSTTSKYLFDVSAGNFHADGNIIGYSTSVSDIRLKENITKLDSPLNKVLKLNAINFEWIDDKKDGNHIGYIAQEVEKIIPDVVVENKLLKYDNDNLYKTIRYTEIIPYLSEAIKEQQNIINKQQNDINDMKKELESIKNKLN